MFGLLIRGLYANSESLMRVRRYTLFVSIGKVVNRAGLELPRTRYDTVIVGGGLLGLACAFTRGASFPNARCL